MDFNRDGFESPNHFHASTVPLTLIGFKTVRYISKYNSISSLARRSTLIVNAQMVTRGIAMLVKVGPLKTEKL